MVRPVLRKMLVVPFTILPAAGGRIVVQRALCDGVLDNFVDANVYLGNAPNVVELAFEDAEFVNSEPKLFHLDGFDLAKLRYRGVRHNGTRITGKDYEEGAPTFANGWTGSNLRIVKLPEGRVALYGVVIAGTTSDGTLIMTLPAGFRPAVEDYHRPALMDGGGTFPLLRFETDGDVYALSGVTGAMRFNGLTFMAA